VFSVPLPVTHRDANTQAVQHLHGCVVALADKAKQKVLGADVVVAELPGLAGRRLQHLARLRRELEVPGRCLLTLAADRLDLLACRLNGDPK
jgi:hypothetical protein